MQLSKGWRYDMVTEGEWEGRGFLSALHTRKGNDLSPLAEIYVILGGAYWRVGASDEKAIQSFEKAIEIRKRLKDAHEAYGLLKGLLASRERGESKDEFRARGHFGTGKPTMLRRFPSIPTST